MVVPRSPYYRRNRLDPQAQARYDLVVGAVQRHEATLPEGTSFADWTAVADHPELFWLAGPIMQVDDGSWSIQYYDLTDEEIVREQASVDRAAERLLAHAPTGGTDWDKALYVYETAVRSVRYQEDTEGVARAGTDATGVWQNGRDFSRTICGPLVEHWGVCAGYAAMVQYLLQRLGIECLYVSNGKRGMGHAWNIACLDGHYCFIDATFGRSWSLDQTGLPAYVAHDWFGFSASDLGQVGIYDMLPTIPWPEHVGSACDWYRRTGWFVEGFDPAAVDGLLARARCERLGVMELKCRDDAMRDEVQARLEGHHGLACYRHRLGVLAVPLEGKPRLAHVDADDSMVRP